jgi:sugar lactone lactonase YvrE
MRLLLPAALLALAAASCNSPAAPGNMGATDGAATDSTTTHANENASLKTVFEIREPQLVAATLVGERMFIASPRWSHNPTFPLAETGAQGTVKPYPDASWCIWNDSVKAEPQKHWISPQGLITDDEGMIWVLDPAAPGMQYNIANGPKLVRINPNTNKVVRTIVFDRATVPHRAYLNDVRVDLTQQVAYITESNLGGLYVVDLKTGRARRVLTQHPSVHAEPGIQLKAEGHPMIDQDGKPMIVNSDGIALSPDNQQLYYHALTGHTLYRVPTAALRDASLSEEQLGAKVEKVATTPATDGMMCDPAGNIWITAFEENALVRVTTAGKVETMVKDPRLQWPDSYCFTASGQLYVTASMIHKMPQWNNGRSVQTTPFRVLRMALPK